MTTIGFYHQTSNRMQACEYAVNAVRTFYPDSFYMISCDAGPDYYDLCKKYTVELIHSQIKLGYPIAGYGYKKQQMLELIKRFYIACIKTNTTHLVYMEDDVLVKSLISVEPDWEIAAYHPNCQIPQSFIDIIENFSGIKPNVTAYGTSGGSIFKVETFIDNYFKIKSWIENDFEYIQNTIYPTVGWIDCFLTYFYLMAGKKYTVNPYLHQIWTKPNDILHSINSPVDPQILHGFKTYY